MDAEIKYRVWNVINFTSTNFYHVNSIEQAKEVIKSLISEQVSNPAITDNAFGLEVFDSDNNDGYDDGWSEWYDDNDNDILDVLYHDEKDKE